MASGYLSLLPELDKHHDAGPDHPRPKLRCPPGSKAGLLPRGYPPENDLCFGAHAPTWAPRVVAPDDATSLFVLHANRVGMVSCAKQTWDRLR